MATLESISTALSEIATKKTTLQLAFDALKSHPQTPSSFTLTWSQIDSYITTFHSSLLSRFQTLENSPIPTNPTSELIQICLNMDSKGLGNWVVNYCEMGSCDFALGFVEMLKDAPNPARLVIDAIEGGLGLGQCRFLWEGLIGIEGLRIEEEVKEKARRVGAALMENVRRNGEGDVMEVMDVMRFLGGFRIGEVVGKGEVVEFVDELVCRFRKVPRPGLVHDIWRLLGVMDHEIFQGLVSMGKPAHALRLIYQLKLSETCPPVPLLKSYLQDLRYHSKETCQKAKTLVTSGEITIEQASKLMAAAFHEELHGYEVVINLIIAYNLGTTYPIEEARYRLQMLRKFVLENKPVAAELKVLRKEALKKKVAAVAKPTMVPKKQQQTQNPAITKTSSSELSTMERNMAELRQICERMEGFRLREWLKGCDTYSSDVEDGLLDALKFSPDSAGLVLDVIDGYLGHDYFERSNEKVIRVCCLFLDWLISMEGLNVSEEVKEAARRIGMEWKAKTRIDETNHVDALMVLLLFAGFRLKEDLDESDVIEYADIFLHQFKGFRYLKLVANIYQVFGMEDKLPELVRNHVMRRGRPEEALELINELKLSDKCPPVPLLNSYVQDAKKNVEVTCEKADKLLASGGCSFEQASNYKAEAFSRELAAMEVVVRLLGAHNLRSSSGETAAAVTEATS
ncbi:FRIGIDA-like protein [Drosera capensis]